jgi:response regulator RpfG family c-di-GMP phosphodiesterase
VRKISVSRLLKYRMFSVVFLAVVMIISLSALPYFTIRHDYQSRTLVNVLGKQRMLTQMMAKQVTKLYLIYEEMNDQKPDEIPNEIRRDINLTRIELQKAVAEFDYVFSSIENGGVYSDGNPIYFTESLGSLKPILEDTGRVWDKFKESIEVITSDTSTSEALTEAILYINSNNETLLKNSDTITNIIVDLGQRETYKMIGMSVALAMIVLISVMVFLFNTYRYMFVPLDELYSGLSKVGITRTDLKVSKHTKKDIAPVISEVSESLQKLNKLIKLIENLNENKSFNEILKNIYSTFSVFVPYTYIGIGLIENDGETVRAAYAISDDTVNELFRDLSISKYKISETTLGRIIETGKPRVINDLEEYVKTRPHRDYNETILKNGIKSSIALPLKINDRPVGIIFFSSRRKDVYNFEHVTFLKALANSIALSLEKNLYIHEILYSSILALAKLAESRDNETGEHLNRMKMYSRLVAQLLYSDSKYKDKISPEYIDDIEKFSPLHDIGKVSIRDEILLKPGKLTKEEFEIMKTHAEYGAKVLESAEANLESIGLSAFKMGIEIASGHHEKWDGSGYPCGTIGEAIPLSARIVAVADVFDALTSQRPYKKAFSVEGAYRIIEEGSGKHFDPEIVRVFVENRNRVVDLYNFLNKTDSDA